MAEVCQQCGKGRALARLNDEEGTLLCLDCWERVERIGQMQYQQAAALAAMADYASKTIPAMAGLAPWPDLQLPQQPTNIQMTNSTFNNLNLSGSQVGILNTGDMVNLRNIDLAVTKLSEDGNEKVAEALKEMAQALAEEQELGNKAREEAVELLSALASLADQGKEKRGVAKALISRLLEILGAGGNLASIWETWGETITQHFSV